MSTCLYRRTFEVSSIPESFRIFVSADTRYRLWLNGKLIGRGPLKGTAEHYFAETYELAPLLQKGINTLAAEVRWHGKHGPESEVYTQEPGLYIQGFEHDILDTPGNWKIYHDISVSPNIHDPFDLAVEWLGYTDYIDGRKTPRNWQSISFDDANWHQAVPLGKPPIQDEFGVKPVHCLFPADILPLVESPRSFHQILENRQPRNLPWTVDAGQFGEIWLNPGSLVTSYLEFEFEGGAGRTVHIVYAEALRKTKSGEWKKGRPRGDFSELTPEGYRDTIILPGDQYYFEPFHWRPFSFVKIIIEAGDTPVTLKSAAHRYTTFSQTFTANFDCAADNIEELWDNSLRTLELCAHETYEDCPYYEQLNYTADTRIQALASYWLSGNGQLGKRCIALFSRSLSSNGLISSREPSIRRQEMPAFSLHWILMLGDYWNHYGEAEIDFINEHLTATNFVLSYFRDRIASSGFVGTMSGWPWIDWMRKWTRGVPPAVDAGTGSTYMTALYAIALETASKLFEAAKRPNESLQWDLLRKDLVETLQQKSWSADRGYFMEGPTRDDDQFSQHTQIVALLAGAANDEQKALLRNRLLDDPDLAKVSLFHRFYLAQALLKLDNYERFFSDVLAPWYKLLEDGFTTWPENEINTRSDCHAWSSWIVIEFLRTVLGVYPVSAGWKEIGIAPKYSSTESANGQIPSPHGTISVSWTRNPTSGFKINVESPIGIPTTITLIDGSKKTYPNGGSIEIKQLPSPV
ncbi:alpha-L-rhamnosidase N-terminal domain-containing protein [Puniceicoccaceae bacterium K14]|nr:alpha-L-rhamnosidase N-terminal domain-containing protein [Puniceicoccaceae bacterium K14]